MTSGDRVSISSRAFLISSERPWLKHGNALFQSECFDGRRDYPLSSTCGPVGLGVHPDDLVVLIEQSRQDWNGKGRRAHENDFQPVLNVQKQTPLTERLKAIVIYGEPLAAIHPSGY